MAACTPGEVIQAPTNDAELVQGQNVYTRQCASCHGSDGSGGRGLKLNEGVLLEKYPEPAAAKAVIVDGRRTMPSFSARLSDEDIDAVVRYTREVLNSAAEGE